MNDLLDKIDPQRYDAEAIRDRLNQYEELDAAEANQYMGAWEYAGLDDAEHEFTGLLGESHNATFVARDLDGSLVLLWEERPSGEWQVGPLFADHMPASGDVPDMLKDDLDLGLVLKIIENLPAAPGPVRSY